MSKIKITSEIETSVNGTTINNTVMTFPRQEFFTDIEGYEGLYQIGDMGTVISLPKEKSTPFGTSYFTKLKKLKPQTNKAGYVSVRLSDSYNHKKKIDIHRLVALNHIDNPEGKREVNHIDGDKSNNCIDNLEWTTRKENVAHAVKHGLMAHSEGHSNSRLKIEDIIYIRSTYERGNKAIKDLSNMFDISICHTWNIINKKRWSHV